MVDLYGPFKAFRENTMKVSFALSCGKDSDVMLDIASRFLDLSRHNFFYFTFYPVVLPYKARYLQRLERKYGIHIDIHEQPVNSGLKQSEAFARIREACGAELTGIGYKIYDSLQRRAILKGHEDGIRKKELPRIGRAGPGQKRHQLRRIQANALLGTFLVIFSL